MAAESARKMEWGDADGPGDRREAGRSIQTVSEDRFRLLDDFVHFCGADANGPFLAAGQYGPGEIQRGFFDAQRLRLCAAPCSISKACRRYVSGPMSRCPEAPARGSSSITSGANANHDEWTPAGSTADRLSVVPSR